MLVNWQEGSVPVKLIEVGVVTEGFTVTNTLDAVLEHAPEVTVLLK